MSAYKPWKALERRHAKRMNGVRLWRPDFSDSIPDGECKTDVWDCKAISGQRIVTLFAECRKKYREFTGSRRFHLCLFDPKRPSAGDLVVITAEDYKHLLHCEGMAMGVLEAFKEVTDKEAWEPPPVC